MDTNLMQGERAVVFKKEAFAIMGAAFDVHNEMGNGFAEAVYQECLGLEFVRRDVPYEAEVDLRIHYKGQKLAKRYQPDFVCYGKIIIETKAVRTLTAAHQAQLLNYLKATEFKLGLLINFGAAGKLEYQRLIR